MGSVTYTINYTTLTFWVKILIIILIVLKLYNAIATEFITPGDGERVLVTSENTKSLEEKLDRLCEIATFPSRVVRWHMLYISGVLGAIVSLCLFYALRPKSLLMQFIVVMFPTFFLGHMGANALSYHGASYPHAKQAQRLRMDIEKHRVKECC